jgi:hypothetical protein
MQSSPPEEFEVNLDQADKTVVAVDVETRSDLAGAAVRRDPPWRYGFPF